MNVETRINSALDVRGQFPAIPEGWHYLDSAATAQKPQAVIDAITRAYGHDYATVHRGVYERSAAMTASFEAARATTASLIGGEEHEVVFTRGATANCKPELEIYADDVKCAHGATVGELDPQQLFYAAARGLDPASARALLLEGFVMGLWDSASDADEICEAAREALRKVVA